LRGLDLREGARKEAKRGAEFSGPKETHGQGARLSLLTVPVKTAGDEAYCVPGLCYTPGAWLQHVTYGS
jgi:hypothetical protein